MHRTLSSAGEAIRRATSDERRATSDEARLSGLGTERAGTVMADSAAGSHLLLTLDRSEEAETLEVDHHCDDLAADFVHIGANAFAYALDETVRAAAVEFSPDEHRPTGQHVTCRLDRVVDDKVAIEFDDRQIVAKPDLVTDAVRLRCSFGCHDGRVYVRGITQLANPDAPPSRRVATIAA
jgi:hypothetical protein